MNRCPRCGGFYSGSRCRRDHSTADPVVVAAAGEWVPKRGEWYGFRHTIGSGIFEEQIDSVCQVISVHPDGATVCVYGPSVHTTRVALNELFDLPGDDDGE